MIGEEARINIKYIELYLDYTFKRVIGEWKDYARMYIQIYIHMYNNLNPSSSEQMMHAVLPRKSSIGSTLLDSVFDANAANFWLQKFNPLWSLNQSLGKIVKKQQAAKDTVSLTFRVNSRFEHAQAGQHHPVTIMQDGRRFERTYSLTQLDQQHVMLTVKKVHAGVVSQWFIDQAKVGDVVEFGRPYGDMLLPQDQSPLILLAAGSGITPMYSLIVDALKKDSNACIHLMYWVKTEADVAFKNIFDQFAQQHAQFKFEVFHTQTELADPRLNDSYVQRITNLAESTVYVCGPSGFVSAAESLFQNAKSFKSEAFSLSPLATDEVGFIQVTLTQSQKTVSIPKGQSILVGLEQQNIKPTHGCRMGICNKCACNKAQGSTKNLVNGATNTEPGNLLKICVNSAQTDLVIDL